MPEHGFAPTYRTINYPDRQRKGINNLSSGSTISLTQRPLSTPSMEFVDTAPGTYNLPSMFSPPNVHGIKRLGSSWAYSTGRTKTLTPEGQNYICSHPLQRKFDGQQLGPGSYTARAGVRGRASRHSSGVRQPAPLAGALGDERAPHREPRPLARRTPPRPRAIGSLWDPAPRLATQKSPRPFGPLGRADVRNRAQLMWTS